MNENSVMGSKYYKRLDRIILWPLIWFIAISIVINLALYVIFKAHYFPEFTLTLSETVSDASVRFIESRFLKVTNTLFLWNGILLGITMLLTFIVWNAKKLLGELSKDIDP